MNKHEFLKEQSVGTQFSGIYYVAGVSIKKAKNNNEYMEINLKDRSGSIFAKLWEVNQNIKKDMYVAAVINVDLYNELPSYILRSIKEYDKEVDISNYISVAENLSELTNKFNTYIEIVKDYSKQLNLDYFNLIKDVFTDEFLKEFVKAPANTGIYYGKVGGALENTVNIALNCIAFANTYNFTDKEKASLLTSALLCKIGCVNAYIIKNCAVEKTLYGELINEINITSKILLSKIKDKNELIEVFHNIVSRERSENLPITKAGILLQMIMEADRKMVEMFDYIKRDEYIDENGFTTFDVSNKRHYFVK